jgi:hypothetical protein
MLLDDDPASRTAHSYIFVTIMRFAGPVRDRGERVPRHANGNAGPRVPAAQGRSGPDDEEHAGHHSLVCGGFDIDLADALLAACYAMRVLDWHRSLSLVSPPSAAYSVSFLVGP